MNKKVILIIVTILIVASIFVIGIVGAAIGQTIITVKVTSVEFDHSAESEVTNDDGTTSMIVKLKDGTTSYQLTWKVNPYDEEKGTSNATNTGVTFSSNNALVTVDKKGLVTFPSKSDVSISVTITVVTQDGDKSDSINLFVHYDSSQIIE